NSADEIIAGSRRFGILRYDDDLYKEWRRTDVRNHGINDLVRNNQGLLFAAIPSMGLMRSADGDTWTGVSLSERTFSFQLHANRNGEIWAAAKSGGLFNSTDYGETWSARGFADQQILGFQYTTNRIFAMTLNHLYASTDDGNS